MGTKGSGFIRASEVGEYVFCARAWKLRLEGHSPGAGGEARAAGERWHRRHGRSVRRVRVLRAVAMVSALAAVILLLMALALRVMR